MVYFKMQPYLIHVQQIIIVFLLYVIWIKYERQIKKWWKAWRTPPKQARQLHPRSPRDCEQCGVEQILGAPYTRVLPPSWQDVKSVRGRPKEYASEGHACMNPACPYYKITDQSIHALRRNGMRNQ